MTKKSNIQIPEHDDNALRDLKDSGIDIYDYAKYEGDHIVAYKRWGKGWMRDEIKRLEE